MIGPHCVCLECNKVFACQKEQPGQLKAANLYQTPDGPAPKEWALIPEVKAAKPKIKAEISLQRFAGTNICMWYVRRTVYWNPASDPFIISYEQ